jgi:hypothetical protein
MGTRAKFRCNSITQFEGGGRDVHLSAVYETRPENTENYGFTKATPQGDIKMRVDNPAAAVQFVPGAHYYVNFEPVDGVA